MGMKGWPAPIVHRGKNCSASIHPGRNIRCAIFVYKAMKAAIFGMVASLVIEAQAIRK
jgi:hypothetical protein